MSKILFSPKEVQLLQKNPNVQKVSERAITWNLFSVILKMK
ncbi:hypothetical protein [Lysinibacillus mangiferihumi]|nr:hypothetical protein [Lysinibacillus mangiferihumi]